MALSLSFFEIFGYLSGLCDFIGNICRVHLLLLYFLLLLLFTVLQELRAWLDWLMDYKVAHPCSIDWTQNNDENFILKYVLKFNIKFYLKLIKHLFLFRWTPSVLLILESNDVIKLRSSLPGTVPSIYLCSHSCPIACCRE